MKNIIFGIHSIEEALDSQQGLDKIFIQKDLESKALSIIQAKAKKQKIGLSRVPVQKLDKIAPGNHQGIAAKIAPIQFCALEDMVEQAFQATQNPLFLLCDSVSDVRNFGAIIRTAECAGANGIIIPKQGSAAINELTVKTSAGAIFNIPICKTNHLKDAIFFLKTYDVQMVSANEKSKHTLYDVNLTPATAIIMGSEGMGISKSILKLSDVEAQLPILGQTESLNVSVAAALFLYEAVRQRSI